MRPIPEYDDDPREANRRVPNQPAGAPPNPGLPPFPLPVPGPPPGAAQPIPAYNDALPPVAPPAPARRARRPAPRPAEAPDRATRPIPAYNDALPPVAPPPFAAPAAPPPVAPAPPPPLPYEPFDAEVEPPWGRAAPPPRRRRQAGWLVFAMLLCALFVGGVGGYMLGQKTATSQAQATATALAAPIPVNWRKVLDDPLTRNDGYRWAETDAGAYSCQFTNQKYLASETNASSLNLCVAEATSFSDLAFQVQMTIVQGDCGGLVFREGYYFEVCQNGTYGVITPNLGSGSHYLIFASSPSMIHSVGHSNTLLVVARGNSIEVFVNQQFIGSVSDGTAAHGPIGVVAEDKQDPTVVRYSDAQVWTP